MKRRFWYRILLPVLAMSLLLSLLLPVGASNQIGDINGDGKITVFDAQMLMEAELGLRALTEEQLPAVGDSTVKSILKSILGLSSEDIPTKGGHLNVRIAAWPTGIDPLKETGMWKDLWTTCVYENALTRDAQNNIAPSVCEYELSEDMLTLKLWVRDGVVFSNGDPVNIYDVEASINRSLMLFAETEKYVKPYVKSLTVDGDILTLQFTQDNEKLWYYMASSQPWMAIMPQEICEKYATSYIVEQIDDAIGTGPYKIQSFENRVSVKIMRNEHYVPIAEGRTGPAAPKQANLETMSFWYNPDDATVSLALLNGDYDLVHVLVDDYAETAAAQGILTTKQDSNLCSAMIFNTQSTTSNCAKYPSLRKAIMAAVDYAGFLQVVHGESVAVGGTPIHDAAYDTDIFEKADYFGVTNQTIVSQYLTEAKEEGYSNTPIQIVASSSRSDIRTMLGYYLDSAGINYNLSVMEPMTFNAVISDPNNDWDFYYTSELSGASTPVLLSDAVMQTNYKSTAKDLLLAELEQLQPGTPEYIAKWYELAEQMVEDCAVVHMGNRTWEWYHPSTLHINDTGSVRYLYNTYWDDPENHND